MDFAFTDEQEMFRRQVRSFLASEVPLERIAELSASDSGWDEESWSAMAELGWTSLSIPEEHGGAGMTFVDDAVLFEELGYSLYPGPYLSTIGLALPALAASPRLLAAVAAGSCTATVAVAEPGGPSSLAEAEAVQTKAVGREGSWRLSGSKELVPELGSVDHVVVVAKSQDGVGMWAVAPSKESRRVLSTMDQTRPLGRLVLEDEAATLLVDPAELGAVASRMRTRALAALALEAVGVAQRALELARDYAKERKQFGRPIGAYQAVAHEVTNAYVDTELGRSLAYWAAWCVAEEDPRAPTAAAAAKALASDAAVAACERSIQVHGGVGFTWDHALHRYYKRAQWIATFEGGSADQRAAVAAMLLDAQRRPTARQ
jgi:alkylation response protein AidB-like acyl-CoA dehydrogenase